MSSKEAYKFVKINVKSNEMQQTYILNWHNRPTISEKGYKKLITNPLCLGIYLELLWYVQGITENNHNEYR